MSTATTSRPFTAKRGWVIHLVTTALLTLNGIAIFFISSRPNVFEQDTGIPREEVEAVFPTVVDQVVREGQLVGILLAALGLYAFVVALRGYRYASRVAWNGMRALVAVLGLLGVMLAVGGNPGIGVMYIVVAVILLLGQARIRKASR